MIRSFTNTTYSPGCCRHARRRCRAGKSSVVEARTSSAPDGDGASPASSSRIRIVSPRSRISTAGAPCNICLGMLTPWAVTFTRIDLSLRAERGKTGQEDRGSASIDFTSVADRLRPGEVRRAGSPDVLLEAHLSDALRTGALCSNDPICAQHEPGESMEKGWPAPRTSETPVDRGPPGSAGVPSAATGAGPRIGDAGHALHRSRSPGGDRFAPRRRRGGGSPVRAGTSGGGRYRCGRLDPEPRGGGAANPPTRPGLVRASPASRRGQTCS